ncbi:DUF2919 family protein [Pseudaeromonas sharmana]|uniref:DUF2919 family protein n=1 Tax=Pseudaeromonas sharmana TaxID=328412 RepID=A0ABV8CJT0_9GAMM
MTRQAHWPQQLDPDGYTALPVPLLICLLLLSRGYWLVLMALASRAQSADLLALFYPEPQQLYLTLLLALPATVCWLSSAYRHRAGHPVYHWLWRRGWWLALTSAGSELALQLWTLHQQRWEMDAPQLAMLLIGFWCLLYLLSTPQLRVRFSVLHPEPPQIAHDTSSDK